LKRVTTTSFDRVHALIRNPEYLRDLDYLKNPPRLAPEEVDDRITKEIRVGPHEERLKQFLNKYQLHVPLDPKWVKKIPKELLENLALFTDEFAARIIPHNHSKMINLGTIVVDGKEGSFSKHDLSPNLRDGRYLTLEIDLRQNKEIIMAKVETIIDLFRKYSPRKSTRDTESRKIDKFRVWDEYLSIKNFSKIAEKYNKKEPTVRKAYYRAFELIMGEKYDFNKHNRQVIERTQLSKTCDVCEFHSTCDTLCPDVLGFVDQDYTSRKELLYKGKTKEDFLNSEK
jgi:hypothetical protein